MDTKIQSSSSLHYRVAKLTDAVNFNNAKFRSITTINDDRVNL